MTYSVYSLEATGQLFMALRIAAEDDEEALHEASMLLGAWEIGEVWADGRRVGVVYGREHPG